MGRPFGIGDQRSFPAPATGLLYLTVNDDQKNDNSGEFGVTISTNTSPYRRLGQESRGSREAKGSSAPAFSASLLAFLALLARLGLPTKYNCLFYAGLERHPQPAPH